MKSFIKSIGHTLWVILLILLIYFTVVIIAFGLIEGYSKASWYYQYNVVQTNQKDIKEMIGYDDGTHLGEIPVYKMVKQTYTIKQGRLPENNREIVLPISLAEDYQLNQRLEEYQIVGFIKEESQSLRYYTYTTTINDYESVMIDPQFDMEEIGKSKQVTLNNEEPVKNYIQSMVKAMKYLVVLSLICLMIEVVFIALSKLSIKRVLVSTLIGILGSYLFLDFFTMKFNQVLNLNPYLSLSTYLWIDMIVSIGILGFSFMIKKFVFKKNIKMI